MGAIADFVADIKQQEGLFNEEVFDSLKERAAELQLADRDFICGHTVEAWMNLRQLKDEYWPLSDYTAAKNYVRNIEEMIIGALAMEFDTSQPEENGLVLYAARTQASL